MNPLFARLHRYNGWEEFVDSISFENGKWYDEIVFVFRYKGFWGISTGKEMVRIPDFDRQIVAKLYIKEVQDWVANKSKEKSLIPMAEAALVSSDSNVKDAFIVAYLENNKK